MDILKLAREAGFTVHGWNGIVPHFLMAPPDLQRFADLVRAETLEEAAIACEEMPDNCGDDGGREPATASQAAGAIRALKDRKP